MKKLLSRNSIIAASINAIAMLGIMVMLLNQPVAHSDIKALVRQTSDWKAKLIKEKLPEKDFLFINVSYDKELVSLPEGVGIDPSLFRDCDDEKIPEPVSQTKKGAKEAAPADDPFADMGLGDELGDIFGELGLSGIDAGGASTGQTDKLEHPLGNRWITNRKVMAMFFEILNSEPNHRYMICDVMFDQGIESPNDARLKESLEQLPRVLLPYLLEDDNSLSYPKFNAPSGLASYTAVDDAFIKINVLEKDSLRTVPLMMYEALHHKIMKPGRVFNQVDSQSVFANFILNHRLKTGDLLSDNGRFRTDSTYWKSLSAVLSMNCKKDILEMTKDKIIVIGDFEDERNDFHATVYGPMPGALIMVNTYLALLAGDNVVPYFVFLFAFIGFFFISLVVFYPISIFDMWITSLGEKMESMQSTHWVGKRITATLQNKASDFVTGFFTYMGVLCIISTLSYFMFNIHLNILYLTVYVFGLEKILMKLRQKGILPSAEDVEPKIKTESDEGAEEADAGAKK